MREYDHEALTRELFDYIEKSPESFHAVKNLAGMLEAAGYARLYESEEWTLTEGKGYYVLRNGSSIIAFRYQSDFTGFQIAASHSDCPSFKIKDKGELAGEFLRLNTERYGGMIMSTWLDRPLSVAGRVIVEGENGVEIRLVNVDRDLIVIPSVAIHMNRAANDGMKYNPASDTVPLLAGKDQKGAFNALIAAEAGTEPGKILGSDLFLYARERGSIWGAQGEFISSRALDDLQCAFTSMKGFLAAGKSESIPVCAVFDNEEVGSGTRQGADSTFLYDVLTRICPDIARYQKAISSSFLLSCDNAHAVHPNHPEYCDPENKVKMNEGVVLKFNAGQKYTTDGVSEAYVKYLCRKNGIPVQVYANRSDIGGGSTLGNIATTKVPVCSADVGLPQLAMHSAYESAGLRDSACMVELTKALFEGSFKQEKEGYEFR